MANEKDQEQDRKNETSQQGQQPNAEQGQQPTGQQPPSGQQGGFASQQETSGQSGQSADPLTGQPSQGGQSASGQADGTSGDTATLSKEQGLGTGTSSGDKKDEGGFVGAQGDSSSEYVQDKSKQDFAPDGQGASSANENIETGQSSERKSEEDDSSAT